MLVPTPWSLEGENAPVEFYLGWKLLSRIEVLQVAVEVAGCVYMCGTSCLGEALVFDSREIPFSVDGQVSEWPG
jgi:hypothetical protein